jgi:mono/diheme cytochrome c family protein
MRTLLSIFACSIALGQHVSPIYDAPQRWTEKRNPLEGDERARRAGAKLFARECAPCHGASGQGIGKPPPLNGLNVSGAPPGALFWVLENGSLWHGMPSFSHLPEQQRWQIITFVRGLGAPANSR